MQQLLIFRHLFWSVSIAFLFLLSSCQKEEIIPIQNDYRSQLIGVYSGNLEQSISEYSSETKQTSKKQEILKNHQVEITKVENQPDAIALNGIILTSNLPSNSSTKEYNDVYIYQTLDCDGLERYKLTFYPQQKQLVLEFKHSKTCLLEKLEQNYYFSGIRASN